MKKFLWLLVLMFFVQPLFANESVPAAISKVESWIKEQYKDSPRARKYVEQQLDVIIDSLERDEVKIRKMREKFPQAFLMLPLRTALVRFATPQSWIDKFQRTRHKYKHHWAPKSIGAFPLSVFRKRNIFDF